MAVITPRNGATLAQVVQTALNVVGRYGVSIETGGTGNGVRVPDGTEAEIEAALGWTDAEAPASSPTQEPTPATTQADGDGAGSDSSDPAADTTTTEDTEPEPAAVQAPAPKTKKSTSSRRARRSSTTQEG